MAREIILDTETTGIDPNKGHRLIEIGCLELEDLLPTGRTYHVYINPEREIEPDAERVHGISNAMVADKPKFAEVVESFLEFVGDAQIVAHNAAFDRGFINMELERARRLPLPEPRWVDTLDMARKRYPGMHNSLDALCRRFNISLTERDKHGALIDARLLADVYLELQGGKERSLDLSAFTPQSDAVVLDTQGPGQRPAPLPSRLTAQETEAHTQFVQSVLKDKAVWLKFGVGTET
ncbi:MAG: DNA polymerase III subunit epsilon [Asticcacaulis sp.]